ncbi:hypothetical protein PHYC_01516 [Phycisphaerales bacterium]|nr:hypothetical protein PHYC_01516 [Phycisphaerales bacterium]
MAGQYVQYGCALCAPDGWLNFDASPSLRAQRLPLIGRVALRVVPRFPDAVRYGDIVRGLPVPDASCEAVYCSHVLEHLSLEDCRKALKNTLRILRPGGRFRLVMPDLRRLVEAYLARGTPDSSMQFIREAYIGDERRPCGLYQSAKLDWLGNGRHRWLWDYAAFEVELRNAGFERVRRAAYGDCPDAAFMAVESTDRWNGCLGMECYRPGMEFMPLARTEVEVKSLTTRGAECTAANNVE